MNFQKLFPPPKYLLVKPDINFKAAQGNRTPTSSMANECATVTPVLLLQFFIKDIFFEFIAFLKSNIELISHSVGFEPTTLDFGNLRSTRLN